MELHQDHRNWSTGNLALSADQADRSRSRNSLDATSFGALDHDTVAGNSFKTDHEHGLGHSGLHRIRQQRSSRKQTLPGSATSSRSPSVVALSRSASLSAMLSHPGNVQLSSAPNPPNFSEDLSRFPSESLHSFSFAHQSEEFLHNRQNVLKRSIEFMKDRMGWPMTSTQAGLASAHARVTGDVDAQNMLELLARAHLIEAGNLPNPGGPSISTGPLTGPAIVSGGNIFDSEFVPRSDSPEPIATELSDSNKFTPSIIQPAKFQTVHFDAAEHTDVVMFGSDSGVPSSVPADGSKVTSELVALPPELRPTSLKRTMTDMLPMALQDKLLDTMAQPYYQEPVVSPLASVHPSATAFPSALGPAVHGHTNRWTPAAQAIFTTESRAPWTIIAANDLACLVFGVTKAEVRKMGILEVVQDERRAWLERKLLGKEDDDFDEGSKGRGSKTPGASAASTLLGGRSGITAQLLSKPNSRTQTSKYEGRRSQTVHGGDSNSPKTRGSGNHRSTRSRGVILCGDVVPIQKRNGATGSASLWVKEKKVGLIWVLEEIHDDVAVISLGEDGIIKSISGQTETIWGIKEVKPNEMDVAQLIPRIPRQGIDPNTGEIDFAQVSRRKYFTCPNRRKINIPCAVKQVRGKLELRVSSMPHMAGIIVIEPGSLIIRSANSVFCGALFGFEKADGMSISALIPQFDQLLELLTEREGVELTDGMVIPEDRFRRASGWLAMKQRRASASDVFLKPDGLPARHRDGSEVRVDMQMRVVSSEKQSRTSDEIASEDSEEDEAKTKHDGSSFAEVQTETVYALWVTYSRYLHAEQPPAQSSLLVAAEPSSPPHQPSPGQTPPRHIQMEITSDSDGSKRNSQNGATRLTRQLKEAAMTAAAKITGRPPPKMTEKSAPSPPQVVTETSTKPTIDDYVILEEMGQGAYGQVKLARHKASGKKVVLKYVTKRRILVDTWTRDRKLGTVPLEIHVLDYLSKPEFRHPNIVEMESFFEDDTNYYIEMEPHGLPGMDLFDYIELRANMEEPECRSIFVQVAQAVHFLHTKAHVVHRDIKDENVILDGEGNIKIVDFGSAAYIKSGPFNVFVGTIDYAAPEVLAGKPYGGKEQDVWALGILLYTIIYKENPFYSIDEIMDRDLRIPFVMSEDSIDLIRCMLDRDVKARYSIEQVIEHPWLKADE